MFSSAGGCARIAHWVGDSGDPRQGITFYVGGAGPMGHFGSYDVPRGMQDAGYQGRVELFTWQGVSHTRDQLDLEKNRRTAVRLREKIRNYKRLYPDQPINIIALSAGTGIATFALEVLPESVQIDNVVFLGCSMSARYDLTRALKRIRGRLHCVHSPHDAILRNVVALAGTVDRSSSTDGIAGLVGFSSPKQPGADTKAQYAKLQNIPYRTEFADSDYDGGHLDSTARAFIRDHVTRLVIGVEGSESQPVGTAGRSTTQHRPIAASRPTDAPQPTGP